MANVKITATARRVPLSFAVRGLGLLKCGSSLRVYSPMRTVGCSLKVDLSGLLGEGSPTMMSSMMARMRMIMAVAISMRMGVHRLLDFIGFWDYINYGSKTFSDILFSNDSVHLGFGQETLTKKLFNQR